MRRLLAVALLWAASVTAQERFVIERIDVEDPSGIPDRIVVAETRLEAGQSYTNDQVLQALHRVRRLPFVYRASYRYEPGTTPNSYRLVLTITPMKRFSSSVDIGFQREDRFEFGTLAPAATYRTFVGPSSFEAGLGATAFNQGGGDFRTFNLRYALYDVLGTGAMFEVGLAKTKSGHEIRTDAQPSLRFSVPLTQVQSVVGDITRFRQEFDFNLLKLPATNVFELTTANLAWSYNTIDDPLFTLSGTTITAGPRYVREHTRNPSTSGPRPTTVTYFDATQHDIGIAASASHYFPLPHNMTLRGGIDSSFAQHDTDRVGGIEPDILQALGTFTAAINFGSATRHRVELGPAYRVDIRRFNGDQTDDNQFGALLGYTYRHPRFLFRLTTTYYAR